MAKSENSSKKEKRTSLVTTLVVSVGLVIIALNVVQIAFLATKTRAEVREDDSDDYSLLAEAHANAISKDVEGYLRALDLYVNNDVTQSGDYAAVVDWIRAHADDRDAAFDYIMVADAGGIASTDLGTTVDVNARPYYRSIMRDGKDSYVGDPLVSKTTGQPVVHITRALKANGRTFAMVAGVLPVSTLAKAVNEIKIGDAGYGWMLSSDGTVISHPVSEYVMQKNFITGLNKGHEDMADVARQISAGRAGVAFIAGLGSKEDMIAYHGIEGTSWGLALTIPTTWIESLADDMQKFLLVFGIVIVGLTLVITGTLLVRSLKPLGVVEAAITDIASGDADLTRRIDINSNNEIGYVVKGFNQFTGKLHAIISDVKASKNELTVAGEDMSASAQDTAASITEIIANIESMQHQITNQNASVDETAGAVNQIASNISSLEHMIETQSSGVTQASAAVEEMIGNITSVNQSVDKMASSFGALQQNAQSGIGKQQAVNERIQQIEQQSAMLQEANAAISAIAEQTNLLAMNAAIEAAHAGDAGKGFSVVADEIRKLSETSTSQSKTIGDQLNNIKDSIAEVVTASADSSAAFESVSRLIKETDQLVTQIKSAMEEQQEGSQQITEALHSMNDSTVEVRNAAGEMSEGNKAILNEVRRLQEVTSAMKGSMEEMSIGARKINETGAALSSISDKVKESIVQIGNQIDQFRV